MIERWLVTLVRNLTSSRYGALLASFIEKAYQASCNLNYFDIQHNGEQWLIRKVGRTIRPSRVIDIGANHGAWLRCAVAEMPEARILACEPQPLLAAALQSSFGSNEKITVRQVAVGGRAGSLQLVCYPGHDDLASSTHWHKERASEVITVPVVTARELIEAMGWRDVDYLKIDVEGMELEVFKGLGHFLGESRIGVVQFEFGAFALQQRILMRDFCDLLGENYRVGRLLRNRIDFRPYDFRWERSETCNFVACRLDHVPSLS
jgi:FkbM family methyltransferase